MVSLTVGDGNGTSKNPVSFLYPVRAGTSLIFHEDQILSLDKTTDLE